MLLEVNAVGASHSSVTDAGVDSGWENVIVSPTRQLGNDTLYEPPGVGELGVMTAVFPPVATVVEVVPPATVVVVVPSAAVVVVVVVLVVVVDSGVAGVVKVPSEIVMRPDQKLTVSVASEQANPIEYSPSGKADP